MGRTEYLQEKTVMVMTFHSHECRGCSSSNKAKTLAEIMPSFAKTHKLEKIREVSSGNTCDKYCDFNYQYKGDYFQDEEKL